jgi:hypothetical protein
MSDDTEQRLRSAGVHLPGPSDSDTIDARARFLAAALQPGTRTRARRRTLALAFAAALVVAGAFGVGFAVASSKPAKTTTRIVHVRAALNAGPGFLPAADWDTVSGGTGTPAAAALAANVPLAAEDRQLSGPPTRTVRALGPNGVVLYATFMPANPAQARPQRLLPLQLDDATGSGATRTLRARVAAYDVEVRITFGAAQPPPSVLAAAREELGRLVVPSCPDAQPLTAADVAAAKAYVLAWLPGHYSGSASDVAGATATAALGTGAPRHGQAVLDCGRAVADRSVEVDVTLPEVAKVSASLSELAYFVARTGGGWTVWMRAR